MISDISMSDQQQGPGGLAQLFITADSAIERRRTDNIFKQLDERNLTEDEERIIQQRIDLQRKLLQEYEKREQKRKVAELQDLCPDLSEAAAVRALELCNSKEDEAVLRLTEDAAFKRRVLAETGTYTPLTVLPLKATGTKSGSSSSSRVRGDRAGGSSSGAKVPSPSKLEGNVFVGRFRSKLGPCQERAVADAAAAAARAAAALDPSQPQPKRRGRPKKNRSPAAADATAPLAVKRSTRSTAGATAAAASAPAAEELSDAVDVDMAAGSSDRQRSSSPECEEGSATAADDEDTLDPAAEAAVEDATPLASAATAAAAAGAMPGAADEAATNTDVGTDTDGPRSSRRSQQQQRGAADGHAAAAAAERVISMMSRQIARLEPLLAAGRLLEFEVRRPGSSQAVLDLLAVEYGDQISGPIATAWEVLLEEQKWKEAEELAAFEASKHNSRTTAAPAAAPAVARQHLAAGQQEAAAPAAHLADNSATLQQILAERFSGATTEQQQQDQQEQQQEQADGLDDCGLGAALATAAALSAAPTPAVSGQQQQHVSADSGLGDSAAQVVKEAADAGEVSDASTVTEPTGSPLKAAAAAEASSSGGSGVAATAAAAAAASSGGTSGQLRRGRGRPPKRQAAAAASAAVAAVAAAQAADSSRSATSAAAAAGGSRGGAVAGRAISETGHTCRGRVRQKSHKTTELVELGQLIADSRWYNAGYIFPAGFKSRLLFRSSVDLDALTLHECEIVGEGGKHWPAPTFVVTARDREDEPIVAKSCTGCWSGILKRINAEILRRIEQGEALPPPPRTAIAGPEYFGLNDTATIAAVETLDPNHLCTTYWVGKDQREAAAAGMPVAVQPRVQKAGSGCGRKRGRRGEAGDADDEGEQTGYRGAHWSSISRRERYIKRCTEAGDEAHVVEEQQLLPGVLDPITLEPVVNPAISPAGHVMGVATWKAVLAEQQRCPFTKAPLRADQLIVLTVNNIEKYRDRIIAMR